MSYNQDAHPSENFVTKVEMWRYLYAIFLDFIKNLDMLILCGTVYIQYNIISCTNLGRAGHNP